MSAVLITLAFFGNSWAAKKLRQRRLEQAERLEKEAVALGMGILLIPNRGVAEEGKRRWEKAQRLKQKAAP